MSKINPDTDWRHDPELDELERLSNSVIALIEQGHLGDAERACLELKRRFPDMIDWIERTGAVHEARGEVSQAVEHYRQCIKFIDASPDDFDSDSKEFYRHAIERLQSRQSDDRG
jgi:hypothetical protein